MDLGEARAGMVAAHDASPVLVLSDSPRPFVILRSQDADGAWVHRRAYLDLNQNHTEVCDGGVCRDETDAVQPGSAVLVTGTGRYIVAIEKGPPAVLRVWHVRDDGLLEENRDPATLDGSSDAYQLLASLRESNTLIVRDGTVNHRIGRLEATGSSVEVLADEFPYLKLVAVGNRHVVGRDVLDDTHERLVLVPVDREDDDLRDATPLMVSSSFSAVELTADDEYVIATSGEGDDAETFVFDVQSGALVDRFLGAVVIGARKLESMAGMRATSPDGSHLAYRTPSGALALRDLQAASSCLVRSSSAGDHRIAGFAADGMLYMQADTSLSESHLFAFDTGARRLTALDAPDARGHFLAGVPSRLANRRQPWAIGVRNGTYSALQPDAQPLGIGAQAPVFVPRDDEGLWMADVKRGDSARHMSLRRLMPRRAETGRGFDFGDLDGPDALVEIDETTGESIGHTLATLYPTERPCLATGTPGGWAYQCGGSSKQEFVSAAPMPPTESASPGENLEATPEIPDPNDAPPMQDGEK
ncbi:MAG TPA: hypothetical protein VG755_08490 [Nannocystaceae bacterium]|nr:hypothetical protein [Nannocystaceae bacterium]